MKTIRALAELRSEATTDPHPLECMYGHGVEPDSWIMPAAVRGRYGDNALNFEDDWPTARFVEAAFRDLPGAVAELRLAEAALERAEAEASRCAAPDSALIAALAALRSILSPAS